MMSVLGASLENIIVLEMALLLFVTNTLRSKRYTKGTLGNFNNIPLMENYSADEWKWSSEVFFVENWTLRVSSIKCTVFSLPTSSAKKPFCYYYDHPSDMSVLMTCRLLLVKGWRTFSHTVFFGWGGGKFKGLSVQQISPSRRKSCLLLLDVPCIVFHKSTISLTMLFGSSARWNCSVRMIPAHWRIFRSQDSFFLPTHILPSIFSFKMSCGNS